MLILSISSARKSRNWSWKSVKHKSPNGGASFFFFSGGGCTSREESHLAAVSNHFKSIMWYEHSVIGNVGSFMWTQEFPITSIIYESQPPAGDEETHEVPIRKKLLIWPMPYFDRIAFPGTLPSLHIRRDLPFATVVPITSHSKQCPWFHMQTINMDVSQSRVPSSSWGILGNDHLPR